MAKSTKSPGRKYPKPYDGFPLSAHVHTNRWYKTVGGKRRYCGPLEDWRQALRVYEHSAPYWAAGDTPPPLGETADTSKSVRAVINSFLDSRARAVEMGEMTGRSLVDYHQTAILVADVLGKDRNVETLKPDDFGRLRLAIFKKSQAPATRGNMIVRARSIFKHAVASGITDKAIQYGDQFSKPRKRDVKIARHEAPEKVFTPAEIHALLDAADVPMTAMLLLACNAGLGNEDLSGLTLDALDLDAGTLGTYRQKTGEARRAVLWPETVEAVRRAIDARPEPADAALNNRLFVTTHGREWVRTVVHEDASKPARERLRSVRSDNVAQRFGKLKTKAKVEGKGRGFYALRHSYRTAVDGHPDRPAVDLTMGHGTSGDIRTHYVDSRSISDDRLRDVADMAHRWLWPDND